MTSRPAAYAVELVMGANGADTDTFTVPNNMVFEVMELQHKKTGAVYLDEISDPRAGSRINKSFPVELIAGDGARRVVLPESWVIEGGTTVTVKSTDKSGAGNTLNLLFLGVERFV